MLVGIGSRLELPYMRWQGMGRLVERPQAQIARVPGFSVRVNGPRLTRRCPGPRGTRPRAQRSSAPRVSPFLSLASSSAPLHETTIRVGRAKRLSGTATAILRGHDAILQAFPAGRPAVFGACPRRGELALFGIHRFTLHES